MMKDGIYYQSLSSEDMNSLSITEVEKEFSVRYVELLNKNLKCTEEQ